MTRRALERPETRELAWYFVVVEGENAGGVVAGPFDRKPGGWVRHAAEMETEAPLAAELLRPDEAQEMEL